MTDLSLFRWSEFQVNSGELYNNFKQGASSFVHNVLANPPESITCNSPVENIDWSCNNWVKIQTRNGQQYFAQCVLVTCSIGILKIKLETLFTPLLPSFLGNAINATGFGPIAKIFLVWDNPWWPQSLEGFQFVWHRQFINCCDDAEEKTPTEEELRQRWFKSITGFNPVTGNSKALLGWLGGHEAKFVETLSEEIVGEECAKILRDFTGFSVPVPDKVIV
jgi:spermine oxidase